MWPEDVIDRFGARKVASSPPRWKATCPAHRDRHPSLALWLGRDGRLMVGCWARRCDKRAILGAVGLRFGDLFPPADHWSRPMRRRVVAAYDYRDPGGELLFQVVRFEPKDFRQRRPDGKGGWLWDLSGVERVPYRLPELLADPRQPVIVVEGERDVESARSLGLVATCNPGGAGKWEPAFGLWLQGRRVAVLPDNDPPGLAHALQVAASCIWARAASVRVVELPGLPPRGDLSWWLSQLKAGDETRRRELVRAITAVPEWRPSCRPSA